MFCFALKGGILLNVADNFLFFFFNWKIYDFENKMNLSQKNRMVGMCESNSF